MPKHDGSPVAKGSPEEIDHAEGNPMAVPVPEGHAPVHQGVPEGPMGPGGAYNPEVDAPETGDVKKSPGKPMIYDGVSDIPGLAEGGGIKPPRKGSVIIQ